MQNQNHFPHIPSARCVITNDQNEILMVKRSDTSNNNPGQWELPGGKIKLDDNGFFAEDVDEAIIREALEEAGTKVNKVHSTVFVEGHDIPDGPRAGRKSITFVGRAESYSGTPFVADQESSAVRWWPAGELPPNVTHVSQLAIHRFLS